MMKSKKGLILACAAMLAANALARLGGPGFPQNSVALHLLNPTFLTPNRVAFFPLAAVCFSGVVATAWEVRASPPGGRSARRRVCLALAFLLNSLWLMASAHEHHSTALVLVSGQALALLRAYLDLDIRRGNVKSTPLFVRAAFGVSMAWACIAVCIAALVMSANLDKFLSEGEKRPQQALRSTGGQEETAVKAVWVLTALGSIAVVARYDWPFAATIAVVLEGVHHAQAARGADSAAAAARKGAAISFLGVALAAHWAIRHTKARKKTFSRSRPSDVEEDFDDHDPRGRERSGSFVEQ
mmetsp:Transcript_68528/g.173994  ORF Transcript_68528/g.173994 Transcript_68528/m.173994 type:complete len:299 (-) Transcript_68528:47-943(-)|eukprot:CAMPEP_0183553958 /NCGR_PEP_ID=MMETSP0371-20130417/76562_1 /TAXON_ID=268820 /ORGANISM="Peridinium aciculiferum, Strain PAER-2" /LENGTH=298 /DNA_ID=CAMNT_0025759641 /DNA_START=63 /DNA_END=959 /DNA_ORIENTATION=+